MHSIELPPHDRGGITSGVTQGCVYAESFNVVIKVVHDSFIYHNTIGKTTFCPVAEVMTGKTKWTIITDLQKPSECRMATE